MRSMTGYGRAEYCENGLTLQVELKSVNNRNLDINCKIPRAFISLEDAIRKTVQSYAIRGRIDLFVSFSDTREKDSKIDVDLNKAKAYFEASEQISAFLNISNDMSVSKIMKCPDVVTDNTLTDETDFEEILKETVASACKVFNEMREIEGKKLVDDMLSRVDTIENIRKQIKEKAPLVASQYKKNLKERIQQELNDVKYDEARLLNEVAFYTDRVNIDEELTRLGSHVIQFRQIVKDKGAGKKLDFLMQEFNREANTICSKSNNIDVTNLALSLKNEIEKIREQVQNLE